MHGVLSFFSWSHMYPSWSAHTPYHSQHTWQLRVRFNRRANLAFCAFVSVGDRIEHDIMLLFFLVFICFEIDGVERSGTNISLLSIGSDTHIHTHTHTHTHNRERDPQHNQQNIGLYTMVYTTDELVLNVLCHIRNIPWPEKHHHRALHSEKEKVRVWRIMIHGRSIEWYDPTYIKMWNKWL